jgi:DNA-binding MarR family transcriptional regulator
VSTEPRWLSEKERATWVQLSAVLTLLPAALDSQLRRDADLTLFEYYVLAMLSEAPDRTLRMSTLASQTNATLSRLSHVVTRLTDRGLVDRYSCPEDGRATNARLTALGWARLQEAAPKHVATVRDHVIDALTPRQVGQLSAITAALLGSLDPDGAMAQVAHPLIGAREP